MIAWGGVSHRTSHKISGYRVVRNVTNFRSSNSVSCLLFHSPKKHGKYFDQNDIRLTFERETSERHSAL